MTMKHPYDGLYLQEIAETQGALFERLRGFVPNWMGQFYAHYQCQVEICR